MKQQTKTPSPSIPVKDELLDMQRIYNLQLGKSHTFYNRTNVFCSDGSKLFTIEHEDYTTPERRMQIDLLAKCAPEMLKALDLLLIAETFEQTTAAKQYAASVIRSVTQNAKTIKP